MRVVTGSQSSITIAVGDILQFNHSGSAGEHGFYLVCRDEEEGFFIMNLSGKKRRITYYSTLSNLMNMHRDKIKEVFPADKFQITLTKVGR